MHAGRVAGWGRVGVLAGWRRAASAWQSWLCLAVLTVVVVARNWKGVFGNSRAFLCSVVFLSRLRRFRDTYHHSC